jgi:hypothetical protein
MKAIYAVTVFILIFLFGTNAVFASSNCEIEFWGPSFPLFVPPNTGHFCAEITNLTGDDLVVCIRQKLLYTDGALVCGGNVCDSDLEINPPLYHGPIYAHDSLIVYVELEDSCDFNCARHLVYVYEPDYQDRCDYDGDDFLCTYDSGCLEIECPW